MKIKEIIYVLVSSMIFRAFIEIFVGRYMHVDQYYVSLICQAGMYALIFCVCFLVIRKNGDFVQNIVGSPSIELLLSMLVVWPLVLLAFTLGENAIEVMLVARVNSHFAYDFFHFHANRASVYSFLSWRVLIFLLVNMLVAPVVEEFVFRGLLLRKICEKSGTVYGVIISSLLFTLCHFSSHVYLSTFIFSVFVSVTYLRYGSLMLSMLVHGSFNFLAFVHQYYFDIQWTRAIEHISTLSNWMPQILMFVVTIPMLLIFAFRKNWLYRRLGQ